MLDDFLKQYKLICEYNEFTYNDFIARTTFNMLKIPEGDLANVFRMLLSANLSSVPKLKDFNKCYKSLSTPKLRSVLNHFLVNKTSSYLIKNKALAYAYSRLDLGFASKDNPVLFDKQLNAFIDDFINGFEVSQTLFIKESKMAYPSFVIEDDLSISAMPNFEFILAFVDDKALINEAMAYKQREQSLKIEKKNKNRFKDIDELKDALKRGEITKAYYHLVEGNYVKKAWKRGAKSIC